MRLVTMKPIGQTCFDIEVKQRRCRVVGKAHHYILTRQKRARTKLLVLKGDNLLTLALSKELSQHCIATSLLGK